MMPSENTKQNPIPNGLKEVLNFRGYSTKYKEY